MAYLKQEEIAAVKGLMRKMYFSNDTVERFLATATAGQVTAVSEMIAFELEQRDRRKKERLVRKARFPQIKSFEGYDFSQVAFPEGYTVEDLKSLGFVDATQEVPSRFLRTFGQPYTPASRCASSSSVTSRCVSSRSRRQNRRHDFDSFSVLTPTALPTPRIFRASGHSPSSCSLR